MKRQGFSLIEVLLVMAILALLAGLALPLSRRTLAATELRLATSAYEQCLYRAQELSRNINQNNSWGCHIETGLLRLFAGNTYAGRDATLDEDYEFSTSITTSGVADRIFTKVSGAPQGSGTTTLTSSQAGSVVIDVNTKGTVLY